MLDKFYKSKLPEIERLKRLESVGRLESSLITNRPDFAKALLKPQNLAIIAEYKQASPSRGLIRGDLSVEDVAMAYKDGGAAAISILTEKDWFSGEMGFIDRAFAKLGNFPILRKDFIYESVQIRETALTNAAAILLITRCMKNIRQLKELLEEAQRWNLQCVVEIFDENDLEMARKANAKIIQVNARDLSVLKVDRDKCLKLIKHNPPEKDEIWIAASGLEHPDDLKQAYSAGYKGALIGTALMRHQNPGEFLSTLIKKSHAH